MDDTPLRNPNLLTLNRVYSQVGHTRILQAEPGVLHFGGYSVGQVFKQVLRIRNVRASATRFHIISPTTPFFKATCPNKKGALAPGMSEEIVVEFLPTEYRYFYDCIRIHCQVTPLKGKGLSQAGPPTKTEWRTESACHPLPIPSPPLPNYRRKTSLCPSTHTPWPTRRSSPRGLTSAGWLWGKRW